MRAPAPAPPPAQALILTTSLLLLRQPSSPTAQARPACDLLFSTRPAATMLIAAVQPKGLQCTEVVRLCGWEPPSNLRHDWHGTTLAQRPSLVHMADSCVRAVHANGVPNAESMRSSAPARASRRAQARCRARRRGTPRRPTPPRSPPAPCARCASRSAAPARPPAAPRAAASPAQRTGVHSWVAIHQSSSPSAIQENTHCSVSSSRNQWNSADRE